MLRRRESRAASRMKRFIGSKRKLATPVQRTRWQMIMGDSIPIRSIAQIDRAPQPAPHPFLLKVATRLLAKAERSESERAVRLRLDRSEVPELYDHVDAEALRLLELLINDLCSTGWVRLLLAKARDFAGIVDRKPQLELIDFDALADWAGYQRQADRWNRKLVAYLARLP
jgi:hypothetical protein